MTFLEDEHRDESSLLIEADSVEELRALRVYELVNVGRMTWFFFCAYMLVRGFYTGATICLIEFGVLSLLGGIYKKQRHYQRIMHLFLGLTSLGLLQISISVPDFRATMLFFPVSILVASMIAGVSAAFQWLIVTVLAHTAYFFLAGRTAPMFNTNPIDELILVCGVGVCVFFCCQQGEEFYRARTSGLVNLSERLQKKASRLHELATTDSLTGLVNRFQFQKHLESTLQRAVESSERMALLVLDMDGFKEINDTLGHPVGDKSLIEIAARLEREFSDRAIVARLGGDEFCLIFTDVKDVAQVESEARIACQLLNQRYEVADCEFPMGVSIGIAFAPDDSSNATDLLAFADTAMFVAKDKAIGYACYHRDMTERLIEYRATQEKLALALDQNEFFLVYQPQLSVDSGKIIGVEALLRWRHDGMVIPPSRFVHLLERSREIVRVGNWIIDESCRQQRKWADLGFRLDVSINLSSVQFNGELVDVVETAMCRHGIDPQTIDFEITESLLVEDVEDAVERLNGIKRLGASISIDDFGTGYSSLAYLQQFPIDRLKIDRAFVKDYPESDDGVIAASIVALAKAIGVRVLAEGVETEQQLEFLRTLNCDEYQGYFYSRPIESSELITLLEQERVQPHQPA